MYTSEPFETRLKTFFSSCLLQKAQLEFLLTMCKVVWLRKSYLRLSQPYVGTKPCRQRAKILYVMIKIATELQQRDNLIDG